MLRKQTVWNVSVFIPFLIIYRMRLFVTFFKSISIILYILSNIAVDGMPRRRINRRVS